MSPLVLMVLLPTPPPLGGSLFSPLDLCSSHIRPPSILACRQCLPPAFSKCCPPLPRTLFLPSHPCPNLHTTGIFPLLNLSSSVISLKALSLPCQLSLPGSSTQLLLPSQLSLKSEFCQLINISSTSCLCLQNVSFLGVEAFSCVLLKVVFLVPTKY